jgi:hypothetical protein
MGKGKPSGSCPPCVPQPAGETVTKDGRRIRVVQCVFCRRTWYENA